MLKRVVHHLLVDIAFLCHQIKDRRYGVAVFLYNGYGVVFEHTRNVLVEAASGDVAACFYGYTGIFDGTECFYVDTGRCKQGLAEAMPSSS